LARRVQNKVLEGMAIALPVLVSRMGLEGIEAERGQHILLADSPEHYLSGIAALLDGQYPALGAQARARVQSLVNWDQTLPAVVELLTQADALPPQPEG